MNPPHSGININAVATTTPLLAHGARLREARAGSNDASDDEKNKSFIRGVGGFLMLAGITLSAIFGAQHSEAPRSTTERGLAVGGAMIIVGALFIGCSYLSRNSEATRSPPNPRAPNTGPEITV